MILFKTEHMTKIQRGRKTQTRRVYKERQTKDGGIVDNRGWNEGSVHLAKTVMLSKEYFAKLKILNVRKEKLGDISLEDVKREGYETLDEFKSIWKYINKEWDPDMIVWVITFRLYYSDFHPGDTVKLSPECAEYLSHGDISFKVLAGPWYMGYNELVEIESETGEVRYSSFTTDFLEKVEVS